MTSKSSRPRERAAARKKLTIDDIVFEVSEPTLVARERLYTWMDANALTDRWQIEG